MEKRYELAQPASCLNKASATEIIFVLRANDPIAPQTIRHWATMAEGLHEPEKVIEARACADAMEEWLKRNSAKGV